MTAIGCLHAHHSNIEPIERAMLPYEVELVHFVDPGLDRVKNDPAFTAQAAAGRIRETIHWISQCRVDALLVTCTYFTAMIPNDSPEFPIPVIKIDQPLFDDICEQNEPVIVVFTNPDTVDGTMRQLLSCCQAKSKDIKIESALLPNTFQLMMQGKKEAYIKAVSEGLDRMATDYPQTRIVAGQLSMAPAAELVSRQRGVAIGNQLHSLADHIGKLLGLKLRTAESE